MTCASLTFSAASADSASDLSEQACEQLHSVKSTPTAAPCSPSIGQMSLALPTSAGSTATKSAESEELTPSAVDSLVKTSATPAKALDWPASAAAFGLNTRASLASFDRDTSSWRTSQLCFIEGWQRFAETWPDSGTTQNGQLFRRAPWVPHMCDDECSLWPTPTASMDGRGFGIPLHEKAGRYKKATVRRVHALVGEHGWRIHPNFTEALMGFDLEWTAIEQSEIQSSRRSRK